LDDPDPLRSSWEGLSSSTSPKGCCNDQKAEQILSKHIKREVERAGTTLENHVTIPFPSETFMMLSIHTLREDYFFLNCVQRADCEVKELWLKA